MSAPVLPDDIERVEVEPGGPTLLMHRQPDLQLGHAHVLWFYEATREDGSLQERAGALVAHRNAKAPEEACFSGVTFRRAGVCTPKRATWDVLSEQPLTLAPSLLCTLCGDHGFVREGRWVPA